MNYISVTYTFKFMFKTYKYYKWTTCGKLFNTKTGRIIKKVYNSGCLGYWIKCKFYSLTKLKRDNLIIKVTELDKMLNI